MAQRYITGLKSFLTGVVGKTRVGSDFGEKRAIKREADVMRVAFEHNLNVRGIIEAKRKSEQIDCCYSKDAFIDHVADFYSESWSFDKTILSNGIDALTDFFKRKHTDLAVCGDVFDRQLVRDFALIKNKEEPKGFIADE